MNVKMKDDIIFESFDSHIDLKNKILEMIFSDKTEKILHKGYPNDLDYKQLKKMIDYHNVLDWSVDEFKSFYNNVIEKAGSKKFCIIYRF